MSPRKPPDRKWESWTEEQIRAAQEGGAFDGLSGAGKPIPGLSGAYDPNWWVKQLVQRERLSVLPDALQIKKEVEDELARVWTMRREREVRAAVVALNARIAKVNATVSSGPPTTVALLDIEAIVREWQTRRAAGQSR